MTTDRVSLSDLKAKRAAMLYDRTSESLLVECLHDRNAAGIVATHNAADVLIEIAEAALALRLLDEECTDADTTRARRTSATDRLDAALAKITP